MSRAHNSKKCRRKFLLILVIWHDIFHELHITLSRWIWWSCKSMPIWQYLMLCGKIFIRYRKIVCTYFCSLSCCVTHSTTVAMIEVVGNAKRCQNIVKAGNIEIGGQRLVNVLNIFVLYVVTQWVPSCLFHQQKASLSAPYVGYDIIHHIL